MKVFQKIVFALTTFVLALLSFGCAEKRSNEVVVYTYDSFVSEWGPGPELEKKFKEKTGLTLRLVDCGDALMALSRAEIEKNNVQADAILGLDTNCAKRAIDANILFPYETQNKSAIAQELYDSLQKSGESFITPFDFSHFAMIFDTESKVPAPETLSDLANPIYEKKIILMDPRTSTPGLGFVAWTESVFGKDALDFWKKLKPNILTFSPSWSAGYGLFTNGEAPLVISYTTSPAYHVEYDKSDRFRAILFPEGHPWSVEGVAILNGAKNPEGAKKFIDFLTSEEGQAVLPLTQWMYPANGSVRLPQSYQKAAPIPAKTLVSDPDSVQSLSEEVVKILSE